MYTYLEHLSAGGSSSIQWCSFLRSGCHSSIDKNTFGMRWSIKQGEQEGLFFYSYNKIIAQAR